MVEFLTEGIYACESLGEAFRNLVVGILKELQQLFAKELVRGLMNMWFGGSDDASPTRNANPKPYDDTSNVIRSVDYNAWVQANQNQAVASEQLATGFNNVAVEANNLSTSFSNLSNQVSSTSSEQTTTVSSSGGAVTGGSSAISGGSYSGNFITNIFGSQFMQTLGSMFATYTLATGDTKERLLSMIYLQLQLILQTVSNINAQMGIGGFATGGYISGRGTGTSDSIPAMLSNGEFVIKASSVKKYGTNFLNAVNDGSFSRIPVRVPKFADGGIVNEGIENTARSMNDFAKNIGTNVSTTNKINLALVRNEDEAMEHFMRSGAGQRAMLDFTRKNASFIGKITRSY